MDAKKSAQANLENTKSLSLMMGLIMVLSLLFIVFEWSKKDFIDPDLVASSNTIPDEDLIPITMPEVLPPPPPPPPVLVEEIRVVEKEIISTVPILGNEDEGKNEIPVYGNKVNIPEPEVIEELHYYVEEMPEFKGNVFEFLSENLKYPTIAQEIGLQGKVTCQFVVNKDGSITDVVVVKGVDPSLDKEAIRVIKSMPNWKPGRLNGKPVRVRFTLPVRFKLI